MTFGDEAARIAAWLRGEHETALRRIAAGDHEAVTRRYLPAAFAAGLFAGCLLALLNAGLAALAVALGGAAGGYAARSYVSHRRRQRALGRYFANGA